MDDFVSLCFFVRHLHTVLERNQNKISSRRKRDPALKCAELCEHSCADPASFVRGGPNLKSFFFFLVDEGIHYNWAIISPPAKRHLKGVSLVGRWWPNIECWLSIFVIFQGIRTSIAKKPYIFVIFQGGPDPLSPPPSGSAHEHVATIFSRNCVNNHASDVIHVFWFQEKSVENYW